MTDKELLAHEYAIENWEYYEEGQSNFEALKKAVLYGLEAGRPEWHDLHKNPNDLPEILHPVYAKLDSGTYVFAYCVNKIWHGNDDGIILYHGNGKSEVIAWCEIPKFEDGE